ncbi:VanZ family protein [Lentilactobacillus otakiensis]|uniref:Integral membrane protein n=1 Tax=Lentilactobacillus otakiensis DSM 19908 = JCM 15040 TaxID=1423780 RepID=S4NJV4_9LACO|nr:VanZ family protein [Lentilactobacillus otakiensis]KRL10394.1 VanZ family protein [Lentilactobacillus otakiensis DSM 19908 = JCM 15040]MBZ3777063.1 VanZ family protein [Lentilactobacillus otakiensis]MDV3518086.1 VanZ family protein [Lentilactobacillus otakiensis]GAD16181.1 integral membrane protein [Lentilactobacillus otakiensis DSM 19908 = JCM 15040]
MSSYIHVIYTAAIIFPMLAILITLPILLFSYHRYGALPKWSIFMIYTFVFYMLCAYFLTILPLPSQSFVRHLTTPTHNFVPFTFVTEFIKYNPFSLTHPGTWVAALKAPTVIQPVFNIFLTVPFGFYMHYYFQRSWKQTILFSFCLSLFFELTQISGLYGIYPRPYRLFDVDDLLLNTTGGIIGAWGAKILSPILPTKQDVTTRTMALSRNVSPVRRIAALAVDWIIISIVSSVFGIFLKPDWIGTAICFVVFILGFELFTQRTIGMRLVGIRIVDLQGQNASWIRILVRNLFGYGVIGGLYEVIGRLLDMTGTAPTSQLDNILHWVLILSFFLLLVLVDLLIDWFSQKHLLFFERLSGTDTKPIK